jgi:hypothetical protein
MQVVDVNGNMFGYDFLEVIGINGKPKTIGGGSGTVTSVGLSMPVAFSVANSPVTTSGTIAVTGSGTTSQYLRGDLTLATFPTIPTVGTWGALNYPTWVSGSPFVKMTAAGTFALDTNTYLTSAITSLGGLTGATQTFGNDTNVTMVSSGTAHTLTWSGTLADSRIASAATWNAKQNAITLTTTGTSGASTLVGSILNIPQYSGGGGTIYKLTAQTLAVGSWTLVGSYYQYTFSNANITTNTRVDFTPDNASYTEVTTCNMTTQVTVAAGSCRFYSLFPPQNNITGEVTIFPTV